MACGDVVSLKDVGEFDHLGPLNVAVALDAGIGRKAFEICVHKRINDIFPEQGSAVVGMVFDIQEITDPPGLVDLTAPAVAFLV